MNNSFKSQINKILILGHTCFIGKHLENYLKKKCPEIEIIGKSTKDIDLTRKDKVETLADIINQNTIVIMLSFNARQSGAGLGDFNQNFKMTQNLCSFMEKNAPARFCFFSSQAVYGEENHNPNITESAAVNPTSYYGLAKYISEKLFWKTFQSHKDSSLLVVRMPRIIGSGDNYNNYGPTMFTYKAFCNETISIWGDGLELRDYVYIDDLTDIVEKLVFSKYQGIINIASGKTYSFLDILQIVESVFGRKLNVKYMPRTGSKVDHIFNVKILKEVIGNYNFTPLKESIYIYSKYLNKHSAEILH